VSGTLTVEVVALTTVNMTASPMSSSVHILLPTRPEDALELLYRQNFGLLSRLTPSWYFAGRSTGSTPTM
jgi:hypothetical protein